MKLDFGRKYGIFLRAYSVCPIHVEKAQKLRGNMRQESTSWNYPDFPFGT
jgi:hypothetical protein